MDILNRIDNFLSEAIRWKYKDGRGVWQTGTVEKTTEGQGSDVTYFFKNDKTGNIDVVSGRKMKKDGAKPLYGKPKKI